MAMAPVDQESSQIFRSKPLLIHHLVSLDTKHALSGVAGDGSNTFQKPKGFDRGFKKNTFGGWDVFTHSYKTFQYPQKNPYNWVFSVSHVFRRIDPSTFPNIVFFKNNTHLSPYSSNLHWTSWDSIYLGHHNSNIFWRPSEAHYGHFFVGIFQDIPWYLAPRDLKKSWYLQSTAEMAVDVMYDIWLAPFCHVWLEIGDHSVTIRPTFGGHPWHPWYSHSPGDWMDPNSISGLTHSLKAL